LFLLGLEMELLFSSVDVEADFSSPHIDVCSNSAQEYGRPRMSGVSFDISMSSTTKSTGMK
jgi:hypothetical protein